MVQKKYILPILLMVQIFVVKMLSFFPDFVENYYSNGIYVGISKLERIVFGWIPFSVGDVIYFIVVFFILKWFWKIRKTWRSDWKTHLLKVLSFFSVFYFLFHLLWAVNYHRIPLFEKMAIERQYNDADLLDFTKKVIAKTNDIHGKLVHNNQLKIVSPHSQEAIFAMNVKGYENLAATYPFFKYEHQSTKKSIISLQLTYMGFAGYLNPFTNESQVNYKLPMYGFPSVAAHEMAHQIGYASESEANFVGFLAAIHNEDLYIQYSGYAMALRYCLGNWEIRNPEMLDELLKTIHPGILNNFEESHDFWKQYESFIETGFKIFYDNFLKLNQQKDGLDSYSKFLNLVVNYYKDKKM